MLSSDRNIGRNGFIWFIAYAQVIGIILVVLGHSFYVYPDGCHGASLLLSRLIYSFHMPTFMFASGFLMAYTMFADSTRKPLKFDVFLRKKAERLLVPWFALTLLTFVPRVAMSSMADDSFELSWDALLNAFLYGNQMPIPFFWFLQASFLLLALSYAFISGCIKCGMSRHWCCVVLCAIYLILPYFGIGDIEFFSVGKAVGLGFSFAIGVLYASGFCQASRLIRLHSWWTFSVIFVVWGVLFYLTEFTVWFTLCQLMGIFMVVSLSHIIEDRGVRFLNHLVGANYMIFLLSWYFNMLTQPVLSHYVDLPWWVYTVLSFVFGIYCPYFIYRWIESNRGRRWAMVASFILGHHVENKKK